MMTSGKKQQLLEREKQRFMGNDKIVSEIVRADESPDSSPELWIGLANELAKQRLYRDAVDALSKGISEDPFCGILYRWRAHRYLNCGEIAPACADFSVASRLIPRNWSVWYHLALTHMIMGKYEWAEQEYKKCWEIPMTSSRKVALVSWNYIALMYLGRDSKAAEMLEKIDESTDAGDNVGYKRLWMFFSGKAEEESLLPKTDGSAQDTDSVTLMTQGFGLANYHNFRGEKEEARKAIDRVLALGESDDSGWNCFGYQGARYMAEVI